MLLQIDFASDLPFYSQIRDQIIIGIAAGLLKPGESLPSVRRLAADIGINVHTVHKAYAKLKDQGYIDIDRRSGAKIAAQQPPGETFHDDLGDQLKPIVAAAICHGVREEDFCRLISQTFASITEREAN